MPFSRRAFVTTLAGFASGLPFISDAYADDGTISESDPTAQALGYKADATKVDRAKYSTYMAGETCANCQFYQGQATAPSAPCPLLGSKAVSGKGWCAGYVKKA
ncbi:high-potential iron-sulfur protein [Paraburkholderia jirisanensis]